VSAFVNLMRPDGQGLEVTDPESVIARVKRRSFLVAGVAVAGAFLLGVRRGASLTICAAVVISSFLALEKILERLDPGRAKPGSGRWFPCSW
jgi:hypothetical protein